MTIELLPNFVDGTWQRPNGDALDVENPATAETIARVPVSSAADACHALHRLSPTIDKCSFQ